MPANPYDEHENDLEAVRIIVDKAYTSPDWPYGTPIIVQTWDHVFPTGPIIRSYQLCGFTGYTIGEDHEFFEGCIKFIWDNRTISYPAGPVPPHYRVAVYSEAHGHGISMHTGSSLSYAFGGGDGYVYRPGLEAQVPQSLNSLLEYKLLSLLTDELLSVAGSLWKRRVSSGGLCTPISSTFFNLRSGVVGPFDKLYGWKLNGCGQGEGATAPWGFDNHPPASLVARGDWANHPVWAMVRHFNSSRFDFLYSDASGTRQATWMYWYNPFAAEDEAPSNVAEDGGGVCGNADPYNCGCDPAITTCPELGFVGASITAASAQAAPVPQQAFRVTRGDSAQISAIVQRARHLAWLNSDEWVAWTEASPGARPARIDDGGWGYPEGMADVLYVPEKTAVSSPPLQAVAERYPNIKLRFLGEATEIAFGLSWTIDAVDGVRRFTTSIQAPPASNGWRAVTIYLLGHPGWLPGSMIRNVELTFPDAVMIDYVALHN